jgi:hypothetical protein
MVFDGVTDLSSAADPKLKAGHNIVGPPDVFIDLLQRLIVFRLMY